MTTHHIKVVVVSDKGGVGKTVSAATVWALCEHLELPLKIVEMERSTERKLSSLCQQANRPVDVAITLPTEGDLAGNARLHARVFAPALQALREPGNVLVDVAAGGARGLLEAAEYAEHGDETDGGRGLTFLVVAKAEDQQSATSAEATAIRARAVYPNARIIAVVTHVIYDRLAGTNTAKSVADDLSKSVDIVLLVPLEPSPLMGELYSGRHIALHTIAELDLLALMQLMPDSLREEVAIHRGRFRTWYRGRLAEFAEALGLPPSERTMQQAGRLGTAQRPTPATSGAAG